MRYTFIILSTLLASVLNMTHADEQTDTVMSVNHPATVIITESANGLHITATGSDGNRGYETNYFTEYPANARIKTRQRSGWSTISLSGNDDSSHWDLTSGGLGFGFVNAPGAPGSMGLEMGKSFEITWINTLAVCYNRRWWGISAGIGLDWRNYKVTTSTSRLIPNGDGGVTWDKYPDGVQPRNSRLKVFSLQFPILYTQRLPCRSLRLKLGPILNVNTHASLRTKWRDNDGNDIEEYTSGIHQRKFTVDLFASLSYSWFGFYCRYSPMTILDGHNSPSFRSFSTGFLIFL